MITMRFEVRSAMQHLKLQKVETELWISTKTEKEYR